MSETIDICGLPCEIQKRVLDFLDEKDHVSMFRVSKSWRFMIVQYMNDKNSIKPKDWKWYCRHRPQIPHCSKCMARMLEKNGVKDLTNDWNWWL